MRCRSHRACPIRLPTEPTSPESYLGFQRLERYAGSRIAPGTETAYTFPKSLEQNELAYGGHWRVNAENIESGKDAALRFNFVAKNVYLVLGGKGRVQVLVDGKQERVVPVSGLSRLYTLISGSKVTAGHPRAPLHARDLGLRLHVRLTSGTTATRAPSSSKSERLHV